MAGSCRIGRGGVVDAGSARRRGGTRAWALSTRTDAAEAGGRGGVDPGVRAPYQPPISGEDVGEVMVDVVAASDSIGEGRTSGEARRRRRRPPRRGREEGGGGIVRVFLQTNPRVFLELQSGPLLRYFADCGFDSRLLEWLFCKTVTDASCPPSDRRPTARIAATVVL